MQNASLNVWVLFWFRASVKRFTHFVVMISSLCHVPDRIINSRSLNSSHEFPMSKAVDTPVSTSSSKGQKIRLNTRSSGSPYLLETVFTSGFARRTLLSLFCVWIRLVNNFIFFKERCIYINDFEFCLYLIKLSLSKRGGWRNNII